MYQTDVLLREQWEVQLLKLVDPVLWPNARRAVKVVSGYSAVVLPCSETEESLVIVWRTNSVSLTISNSNRWRPQNNLLISVTT